MDHFVFHHIGIAVRDLQTGVALYKDLFQYELKSGPFDDPIQNVSVCFLSSPDQGPLIELVAPLGPNSPVHRALKQAGGGPYHMCYEVPDINTAISRFTDKGALLLSGPVPAVGFGMREIAWLQTEARLLIELVQQ
jgi:catechol 2,3-dioxygenase-like lactoylglutathione lyase family enzyme